MHLTIVVTIPIQSTEQGRQIYDRVEKKIEDFENIQLRGEIHADVKETES